MTPLHPTATPSADSSLLSPLPTSLSRLNAVPTLIEPLPRTNVAFAVAFVRDGSRRRRELATGRARELQQELGVKTPLQCVPSTSP
ncbi:MAG: hypothetical protein U0003_02640 [Vampirovibrionales bacterium]